MRANETVNFIKKDGIWTAICKSPSVFGQGKTPEDALTKVSKAIDSYLEYKKERKNGNA